MRKEIFEREVTQIFFQNMSFSNIQTVAGAGLPEGRLNPAQFNAMTTQLADLCIKEGFIARNEAMAVVSSLLRANMTLLDSGAEIMTRQQRETIRKEIGKLWVDLLTF